jgi:hypothetical protein
VLVEISAGPDVPPLTDVRVQAVQGPVLFEKTSSLDGGPLPQTRKVTSHGITRGKLQLAVQGLAGNSVEAFGSAEAELTSPPGRVTIRLSRYCPGGVCGCSRTSCEALGASCGVEGDGCQGFLACGPCGPGQACLGRRCVTCQPTTCAAEGKNCDELNDGCGGRPNCGSCPLGQGCGAGGTPNVCAPGSCPQTSCPFQGKDCGQVYDGCRVLDCGACTPPMSCQGGADGGIPNVCGCDAETDEQFCARRGKDCGVLAAPDNCGTPRTVPSCGSCTPAQLCGAGDGGPNVCCVPQCSVCGGSDGCGGVCATGGCAAGKVCDAGTCSCPAGQGACDGGCADLQADNRNCGSCGKVCPNAKACVRGECLCNEPSDNLDGHCCPAGLDFRYPYEGSAAGPAYCYSTAPRGPSDIDGGELDCARFTPNVLTCVGAREPGLGLGLAVPTGASCGTYFEGRSGSGTGPALVGPYLTASGVPVRAGGGGSCAIVASCTNCSCNPPGSSSCVARYYCMSDPLTPRTSACSSDADCPGGRECQDGGACVSQPSRVVCCTATTESGVRPTNACPVGMSCVGPGVTGFCN